MLESLDEVKRRAVAPADRIGAADGLPTFGFSLQDGRPHIEIGTAYGYVGRERGREFFRGSTTDLDEIPYWALDGATFVLSTEHELKHRRPDEDARRQWFSAQEALMASLSERWGARKAEEHRRILERHPFSDGEAR